MKRIVSALSACALVVAFGATAPVRAETIKLRIASGHPPGVVYAGLMKDFFQPELKKQVEAKTKHKIEWVEGYSGSIVKVTETFEGVQNVEDSVRLRDAGVDGIVLSNHGGRQLDRAPIPFRLLPHVRKAVGDDFTVMVDTGIMNGADIVASVALGADFTLIGRAYLYGLMAGGRQGVDRTIEILRTEIERTMRLLGVSTLAELEPKHVTQLARLVPVAADAAGALAR